MENRSLLQGFGVTMRDIGRLGIALGIAAGLSSCAAPPEAIAPSYVSPISYDSLSCPDLSAEAARVDAALAQASQQQEQAHGSDVVSVLLIGVPVSTLSGTNVAPQVASLKGQQQAIHIALVQKHCRIAADSK
jgi:hypothetical protein